MVEEVGNWWQSLLEFRKRYSKSVGNFDKWLNSSFRLAVPRRLDLAEVWTRIDCKLMEIKTWNSVKAW